MARRTQYGKTFRNGLDQPQMRNPGNAVFNSTHEVDMIALRQPTNRYTHTLSDTFLKEINRALKAINDGTDKWKSILRAALAREFPTDFEMRSFTEGYFSEIVGHLLRGNRAIYIHRSLSHGLELFVDD